MWVVCGWREGGVCVCGVGGVRVVVGGMCVVCVVCG